MEIEQMALCFCVPKKCCVMFAVALNVRLAVISNQAMLSMDRALRGFVLGSDRASYKGYSLLLYKEHVREIHELPQSVFLGLSKELHIANQAIFSAFSPWKVNNMSLGNKDEHVHWHIVPRYEEDPYHHGLPFTDVILEEKKIADYILMYLFAFDSKWEKIRLL